MTSKLKSRALLSAYQSTYDEYLLVDQVLQEGSLDLTFHLQFFKKRLSSEKPDQETKFDNMFFETTAPPSEAPTLEQLAVQSEQTKKTEEHPSWAKKLYRKIVVITHPDKTGNITIDAIRNKLNKQYLIATDSMRAGTYEKIMMVANQLDIEVPEDVVGEIMPPKIQALREEINLDTSQMGYKWYYISEDQKKEVLKNYLQNHGFVFTDEMVEQAIEHGKKRVKRKVGQRPVKMRRPRLK